MHKFRLRFFTHNAAIIETKKKEISDFPPSLRTLSLLAFRPKSLLRFDMVFASVTLYFDLTGISRKTAINW